MKKVFALPILLLVAGLLLAACGGSGSAAKLDANDIAVVGAVHITKAQLASTIANGEAAMKAQGQAVPKQGTTGYTALQSQAVNALVAQAMRQDEAGKLGVTVTEKQVQQRLDQIKKTYYGGSEKNYEAALKKQKVTDAAVRKDIKSQLVDQALYNHVTAGAKVTNADVDQYYKSHLSDYTKKQTRQVRHILVKSKSLAQSIYRQLATGNDKTWCTLAKRYSQDPSSKNVCGKLTVSKGETVPAFDKVAFSQPTGKVHAPVYDSAQYKAYFIIEPLSAATKATVTPESQVRASIQQQLGSTKKGQVANDWMQKAEKSYCSGKKIRYQAAYQPSPDLCSQLTATTASTT
jgi:parvulin-like peptidyl-prolyl isomerase